MAERDVIVRIRAIDEASAVFNRVALAAGAFVSFWAIKRGVSVATDAFIEAEASSITLAAALRATGEAAGFTADELEDYADELMRLTTVDDDAFKRIMGIMATFRNVSGEVFKESIELVADMSVQFGGLESGAIRLGKALNDPVKGMSALSRVGIQFSETQKKTIKYLVEQNDLMGAQEIILAELRNQFGGQARAQVDSFGGAIDQVTNAFGELTEEAGKFIAQIPGLITGIQVATVVFENFGLAVDVVWLQMRLSAVGFMEDFRHMFTVQIPEIQEWFLANQETFWETYRSAYERFHINLVKNLWNAVLALKNLQEPGRYEVEFVGLLEGFKNTVGEFPELTERAMTEVEKVIAASLLRSQELLGMRIGERLAGIPDYRPPGVPGADGDDEDDEVKKVRARRRRGFGELVRFGPVRDDSHRAIVLAEKAARNRIRQEALLERIAVAMEAPEMNMAKMVITAFK